MLLVASDSLKADMIVAQPIPHPNRGDLLLRNQSHELDRHMIDRVTESGVTHVWIRVPVFEAVQTNADPQIARGHMQLCQVLHRSIEDL